MEFMKTFCVIFLIVDYDAVVGWRSILHLKD